MPGQHEIEPAGAEVATAVADDLFTRVEQLVLELVEEGRVDELGPLLVAYRSATGGHAALADRSRRLVQQVMRVLRAEGQRLLDAGDLESAAAVLKGRTVADGVEMYVAAASREVQEQATASGAWDTLISAGAFLAR